MKFNLFKMLFKLYLKVSVRFNLEVYSFYLYTFLKDPVSSNEDVVKMRVQEKTMCFVKDTKKQKVILMCVFSKMISKNTIRGVIQCKTPKK